MTVRDLREKYLRFFESKGHQQFPSGSLIPYDVTGRLDESLLFNGAGMVQFKPYFRGVAQPPQRTLCTAQKCVRTGDIESVGDLNHHTFFEMLGNFSFGDYFKREAVSYSWEFLTSSEWLGLDPRRLSFTVFEDDDETFGYWSEHISRAGIDPATRVFRLGEETNYWPAGAFSKGPPGPCGPNSEMFYWVSGEPPEGPYSVEDWVRDDEAQKWLEIWNDVFIQYEWQGELRNPERPQEGYTKAAMPPLPFESIDTGMGLERTAAVLSGKKSTYDTDVFQPILRKIEAVAGGSYAYGSDDRKDIATRIIADHIRTAVFCIADGVLPGNSGRGYVLRRLIRRAVLKGQRALSIEQPFFHEVYEGVQESMGDHYTELRERREIIVETLKNEEALFRRTLASGSEVLQRELATVAQSSKKALPGQIAFRLYDTYGFPLEVTKELCEEAGVEVDEYGYEEALREAQERSRGGQEREAVYGGVESTGFELPTQTHFVGYDRTRVAAHIVGALPLGLGDEGGTVLAVALDQSPFYAESGGQVGDTGRIVGEGFEGRVVGTVKQQGVWVHEVEPLQLPFELAENAAQQLRDRLHNLPVRAEVDEHRRARIMRNHTATHLLHAALRHVLGKHVTQAGSYVGPDHVRFDFTHGKAMTPEEIAQVEFIVNQESLKNTAVTIYQDLPINEAKAMGAMALFGEKYGDKVRMVEIGEFSKELCGGTHVRHTGEIGLFKITGEASAASGVRRIEAVTGEGAYQWVLEQTRAVHEAAVKLKTTPKDLLTALDRLQEQIREERKKRERVEMALAKGESGGSSDSEEINGVLLWRRKFEGVDQRVPASAVDEAVAANKDCLALAALVSDGRITFICKSGAGAVTKGAHAGNLVRDVAKIAGGGGGGRPEFATAGGKDAAKIDEALAAAKESLQRQLS